MKVKIPNNLKECFEILDDSIQGKEEFESLTEKKIIANSHMGLGMFLRNNWGLWTRDSKLAKWFVSKGIQHADDMSGIILTSYHRYLNGKDLNVDEQIESYRNFWFASGDDPDNLIKE